MSTQPGAGTVPPGIMCSRQRVTAIKKCARSVQKSRICKLFAKKCHPEWKGLVRIFGMPCMPPLYIRTRRGVRPTPLLTDALVRLVARLSGDGRRNPLVE